MTAMAQWITQNSLGSFLLRRSLLLLLFISSFVFLWSLALWDTHTHTTKWVFVVCDVMFICYDRFYRVYDTRRYNTRIILLATIRTLPQNGFTAHQRVPKIIHIRARIRSSFNRRCRMKREQWAHCLIQETRKREKKCCMNGKEKELGMRTALLPSVIVYHGIETRRCWWVVCECSMSK